MWVDVGGFYLFIYFAVVFLSDVSLKIDKSVSPSPRTPRLRRRSKSVTSQEDARLSLWFTCWESYTLGMQVTAGVCVCAYFLPTK